MPQLPRSLAVSTQAEPQRVWPSGHAEGEHAPSVQRSPAAHARPQPPQWAGATLVSTQAPPQSVWPEAHEAAAWQDPAAQVWAAVHAVSQEPQWAGSLAVSTQAPPQLVWPAAQDARHAEEEHDSPSLQARSQEPQWTRSLVRSKHASPQRVCPSGQVIGAMLDSSRGRPESKSDGSGTSASPEGTIVLPAHPTKATTMGSTNHRDDADRIGAGKLSQRPTPTAAPHGPGRDRGHTGPGIPPPTAARAQ